VIRGVAATNTNVVALSLFRPERMGRMMLRVLERFQVPRVARYLREMLKVPSVRLTRWRNGRWNGHLWQRP